jgi:hypothetical protein
LLTQFHLLVELLESQLLHPVQLELVLESLLQALVEQV